MPPPAHSQIVRAMLEDVLAACVEVGRTYLVTPAPTVQGDGIEVVRDDGRGQGEAVAAGLARVPKGPVLIVNSDLPCATSLDLEHVLASVPRAGLALVEAEDGTTNALALSTPDLFEPLFGAGSAARYRRLGESRSLLVPNLRDDVDTLADLSRIGRRAGVSTQAAMLVLGLAA